MQSIFKTTLEKVGLRGSHIVAMAYVAIYLGLLGFSLWDLKHIVDDYVYENRLVSVKQEVIADRFPYLKKGEICLTYKAGDYLFPVKPVDKDVYVEAIRRSWRGQEPNWSLPEPHSEVARGIFKIALVYHLIANMDMYGPENLDRRVAFIYEMNASESRSIVDNYILEPESIQRTIEAWNITRPMYINVIGNNTGIFPLRMINLNNICLETSWADKISIRRSTVRLYLDLIRVEDMQRVNATLSESAFLINLNWSPNNQIDIQGGPKDATTISRITVSNTAVFDSSRFPPCTREFESLPDCLDDIKVRTVSEVCNCTQYSLALKRAFINRKWKNQNRKFCTSGIYDQCWKKAEAEIKLRQEKAQLENTCKPCIYSKNSYTMSRFTNDLSPKEWFPRAIVEIICKDTSYLVFEEKHQFNPAQFVAQLGGDFGLYLGFNMMSTLHLAAFCYNWKKRNGRKSNGDQKNKAIRIGKWTRFLLEYLGIKAEEHDEAEEEKPEKYHYIEAMEKIKEVEKEIREIEIKVETLNRKIWSRY